MSEISDIALNKICDALGIDASSCGDDTKYIFLLASTRIERLTSRVDKLEAVRNTWKQRVEQLEAENKRLQKLLNESNKQNWHDRM